MMKVNFGTGGGHGGDHLGAVARRDTFVLLVLATDHEAVMFWEHGERDLTLLCALSLNGMPLLATMPISMHLPRCASR